MPFGRKNYQYAMQWGDKKLRQIGVDQGYFFARGLLQHLIGEDPRLNPESKLDRKQWKEFQALVLRRMRGEPMSRIVGTREFWSMPFRLNAATLDPRPDTETLVETALKALAARRPDYKTHPWRILDLGTGTGCIITAMLHELQMAQGFASDISWDAASMARQNACSNGVGERLCLFAGHWMDAVVVSPAQKFDLILCNPPYIPEFYRPVLSDEVLHFDPPASLWGGMLGLDAYKAILPHLKETLAPYGQAVFEIGADQADSLAQMLHDHGLILTDIAKDLAGHSRCMLVSAK